MSQNHIFDSSELIQGNTQQDLANHWFAQLLSTEDPNNPFISDDERDPMGRRGSVIRHNNFQARSPDGVSFIGGVFSGAIDSPATRTIVAEANTVYFTPLAVQGGDNTTENPDPQAEFPAGYALTEQHLNDLLAQGLNPRDPSSVVGQPEGSLPTLLKVAEFIANNFMGEQFITIDGNNFTPTDIEQYRRETNDNSNYLELPRSTGAAYLGDVFRNLYAGDPNKVNIADPDLGENLDNNDPTDDRFPTLAEINPSLTDSVVPFIQVGYYVGFSLSSEAHTVRFGDTLFGQDVTYNLLNPIIGTDKSDVLKGTQQGDYIEGREGKDILLGRGGNDLLVGGDDRDVLLGGRGDDESWGDEGLDLFIYGYGHDNDKIFDLERDEVIKVLGLEKVDPVLITSNGVDSTQFDFGQGDSLTIVGVTPEELKFTSTFFGGTITFAQDD